MTSGCPLFEEGNSLWVDSSYLELMSISSISTGEAGRAGGVSCLPLGKAVLTPRPCVSGRDKGKGVGKIRGYVIPTLGADPPAPEEYNSSSLKNCWGRVIQMGLSQSPT